MSAAQSDFQFIDLVSSTDKCIGNKLQTGLIVTVSVPSGSAFAFDILAKLAVRSQHKSMLEIHANE